MPRATRTTQKEASELPRAVGEDGIMSADDGMALEGSALGGDGATINSDLGDTGAGMTGAAVDARSEDDDEAIRHRAYGLWEEEGRPDGKHDEHWHRAREQHMRIKQR